MRESERFGPVLASYIERRKYPLAEFARRVGLSRSAVSMICSGDRTPPLERIAEWATELQLSRDESAQFAQLAYLAHCPEAIREEWFKQQREIERLGRRVSDLETRYEP